VQARASSPVAEANFYPRTSPLAVSRDTLEYPIAFAATSDQILQTGGNISRQQRESPPGMTGISLPTLSLSPRTSPTRNSST
jgi:hypothetical protein